MIEYTHYEFLEDIKDTAQWVQRTLDPKPDLIVSIARGGLVPGVYLSHLLEIENRPIVWQTRDSNKREGIPRECLGKDKLILIVDDINDTGNTFSGILSNIDIELWPFIVTTSLWTRHTSTFEVDYTNRKVDTDDWIVFPWEV